MKCNFCNETGCSCYKRITRTILNGGRLCNQFIRNLVTSFIAEKINLYVEYVNYDKFDKLGISLFIGSKVYNETIILTDDNYISILRNTPLINLDSNQYYFQTNEISQLLYNYLHSESIKQNIIKKNPFILRYGTNNDCFVHVRLGDITYTEFNLGLKYYLKALSEVGNFDRLYVASDSPNHEIIQVILETYSGRSERVLLDEVETIQFGSTCRNVVLSHGSFSAVIGWLSFYSNVYYPAYEDRMWHGDMFSVNSDWHKITDYR